MNICIIKKACKSFNVKIEFSFIASFLKNINVLWSKRIFSMSYEFLLKKWNSWSLCLWLSLCQGKIQFWYFYFEIALHNIIIHVFNWFYILRVFYCTFGEKINAHILWKENFTGKESRQIPVHVFIYTRDKLQNTRCILVTFTAASIWIPMRFSRSSTPDF